MGGKTTPNSQLTKITFFAQKWLLKPKVKLTNVKNEHFPLININEIFYFINNLYICTRFLIINVLHNLNFQTMSQNFSFKQFLADLAGFLITLAFGLLMAATIVVGGVLFFIACK